MPQNALVKIRRDVAADWTTANPVLAEGELGWESDTNLAKFGDGVTAWNSLGYFADFASAGFLLAANNLSDVVSVDTSRTNLGLGTMDTPKFASLNLGHASDTTVTRSSAGVLAVEGVVLLRQGDMIPLSSGGTGSTLSDPNADRLWFWDDSSGQINWLTLDTGLSISGTTLSLDSDLASIAGLTTTAFGRGLLTEADAASTRATLGLVIGTNVQAYDADLASIASLATASFGRSLLTAVDADALAELGAHAQVTPTTVAGTSHNLVAGDAGAYLRFTSGSATALNVPLNATTALPVGFTVAGFAAGTGTVTITPESGSVILNSRGGALASAGQYAGFQLKKIATNEWDVWGDLV